MSFAATLNGMAKFIPSPTLDADIARQILYPAIRRATNIAAEAAQRAAPGARSWLTMRDEKVRDSHREADGQTIPDNLKFYLHKVNTGNDANDIRVGYDEAVGPRDPNLPVGQRIHCRCEAVPLPHAVAESIHTNPTVLSGTRVTSGFYTDFPRAADSEFGSDGGSAARFMGHGLDEAAARMREAVARGT